MESWSVPRRKRPTFPVARLTGEILKALPSRMPVLPWVHRIRCGRGGAHGYGATRHERWAALHSVARSDYFPPHAGGRPRCALLGCTSKLRSNTLPRVAFETVKSARQPLRFVYTALRRPHREGRDEEVSMPSSMDNGIISIHTLNSAVVFAGSSRISGSSVPCFSASLPQESPP